MSGLTKHEDIKPENLVWIFGTGRSGSTWLASMMGDLAGGRSWDEPLVGKLFGDLYYSGPGTLQADKDDFVYARRYREAWLGSIRDFVLSSAAARFPAADGDGHLVVKEPNGSTGAPLLMAAMPESRMVLLIRDPRDVVASHTEAIAEGSWLNKHQQGAPRPKAAADENAVARRHARKYLQNVSRATEAYRAHEGFKALLRYENLRYDALGEMEHMYSNLGLSVDAARLARVVKEHAWENIPQEEKGRGKFNRKATPGSWREDLTPRQAAIVEEVTAPLLQEFYPGSSTT